MNLKVEHGIIALLLIAFLYYFYTHQSLLSDLSRVPHKGKPQLKVVKDKHDHPHCTEEFIKKCVSNCKNNDPLVKSLENDPQSNPDIGEECLDYCNDFDVCKFRENNYKCVNDECVRVTDNTGNYTTKESCEAYCYKTADYKFFKNSSSCIKVGKCEGSYYSKEDCINDNYSCGSNGEQCCNPGRKCKGKLKCGKGLNYDQLTNKFTEDYNTCTAVTDWNDPDATHV